MARLTASDMIDIVRDSLGGETSETISDTRILRFINQSYLELCSFYHFDQLGTSTTVTTSSGTATYELSVSNILKITDVVDDTNNFKLYTMNDRQYEMYTQGSASSTTGAPVYWFIDGVGSNNRWNLTFYPTPAGTYTLNVNYTKQPTELTSSPTATSPIIPEVWDDSIIYRAVARGWLSLGEPDMAKTYREEARYNDMSAIRSTYHASELPDSPGSIIGRALRNV